MRTELVLHYLLVPLFTYKPPHLYTPKNESSGKKKNEDQFNCLEGVKTTFQPPFMGAARS
jgi:hypothetical protein